MHWTVKDLISGAPVKYRLATPDEIAKLQQLEGAPHVTFGCLCGCASWSSKNLSLTSAGGYSGARKIFYYGEGRQCSCPFYDLRCIVKEE